MFLSILKKIEENYRGIQTPKQPLLNMLHFRLFQGLIKTGSHFTNLNKYIGIPRTVCCLIQISTKPR